MIVRIYLWSLYSIAGASSSRTHVGAKGRYVASRRGGPRREGMWPPGGVGREGPCSVRTRAASQGASYQRKRGNAPPSSVQLRPMMSGAFSERYLHAPDIRSSQGADLVSAKSAPGWFAYDMMPPVSQRVYRQSITLRGSPREAKANVSLRWCVNRQSGTLRDHGDKKWGAQMCRGYSGLPDL